MSSKETPSNAPVTTIETDSSKRMRTSTLVVVQVCSHLKWRRRKNAMPKFLSFLIQFGLKLPWKMWDDIVITLQMKRLNITEIHSSDEDLTKSLDQENIPKTPIANT